jgi:hypothetical protein
LWSTASPACTPLAGALTGWLRERRCFDRHRRARKRLFSDTGIVPGDETTTSVPRTEPKAIVNRCHPIRGFVYIATSFGQGQQIGAEIPPRRWSQSVCARCGRKGPTYDTERVARVFDFIPLLDFALVLWSESNSRCGNDDVVEIERPCPITGYWVEQQVYVQQAQRTASSN